MNTTTFLNYIAEHFILLEHKQEYNRKAIEAHIKEHSEVNFNAECAVNFCVDMGYLHFQRTEAVSGDRITIILFERAGKTCHWDDIDDTATMLGYSENCGGRIEDFYISEHEKFYNQNHKLIAESAEDFLDYLITVEYDYHHKISERTYRMLRHFGWYEGRHIDTTEFEEKLNERGITLSEEQRSFFSEFSGLYFLFRTNEWYFGTFEEVLEMLDDEENYPFFKVAHCIDGSIAGYNSIQCGDTMGFSLHINSEGIISYDGDCLLGRTMMEGINHLCTASNYPEEEWK